MTQNPAGVGCEVVDSAMVGVADGCEDGCELTLRSERGCELIDGAVVGVSLLIVGAPVVGDAVVGACVAIVVIVSICVFDAAGFTVADASADPTGALATIAVFSVSSDTAVVSCDTRSA